MCVCVSDQDGAEPSGNSVACMNLLRLAHFLDCDAHRQRAERILRAFSTRILEVPTTMPEMTCALMFHHFPTTQVQLPPA